MRRGLKLLDTLILLPGRIELFPDEKGIETPLQILIESAQHQLFPDEKGIETRAGIPLIASVCIVIPR